MQGIVSKLDWHRGDMVVLNDPYLGGTHLPDVTLIAPVFIDDCCSGFVVNRAHHADIGSESPGSMPISSSLEEEGMLLPPTFLLRAGKLQADVLDAMLAATTNPTTMRGDFAAQISANQLGVERFAALVDANGTALFFDKLRALNDYAERLAAEALQVIPDGCYAFQDVMDDDGKGHAQIPIKLRMRVSHADIHLDFSDTSAQVAGNINCPLSVTAAAVFYVFRCLMPAHTPACAGIFRRLSLSVPEGTLLNAIRPAAVAAGNVETSTRIVDVVLGALAQALPARIPAASHGSMNNIAMGARGEAGWDYYETPGGGMGASAIADGLSAVQTHMTNTLNTPIEVLERQFPLRIKRYALRHGSGGEGMHRGGDGLEREYQFLAAAQATLLTERRLHAPWGLNNGEQGATGRNCLNGDAVPGKVELHLEAGDCLSVATPGGGGWGRTATN